MKKILLVLSIIVMLFAFVSCKVEPEKTTAGTPRLSDIDFGKYDAFAVMREADNSKGIGDGISGSLNRLFGLSENALEKIKISDEKGLEWACNEVSNIGKNFLLMGLSCVSEAGTKFKNYIVDRANNKVVDLSFLIGDVKNGIKNLSLQSNAEGLFANKDFTAIRIDIEAQTFTPLTNPDTDKVSNFYRFDNGIMLVCEFEPCLKTKFFNPSNVAPIDYTEHIFISSIIHSISKNDAHEFLTRSDLDFIVDLENEGYFKVTNAGLEFESLKEKHGYKEGHSGYCVIYPKENTLQSTKVIRFYYNQGLVIIYDISSGALQSFEYKAPYGIGRDSVAYNDGHLIYSTSSGLYSLDLENQTTETLVEGSLAKWQMTTGGVIYTKYLTATDVETCFLNLATKETETLSSSGVEVVSIASFVE